MENEKSVCVVCAWRITCNKKFSMDGTTTTRCLEYTRDVTLPSPTENEDTPDEKDET
jgi:hypothetical protein